jgi:hypothetical protein
MNGREFAWASVRDADGLVVHLRTTKTLAETLCGVRLVSFSTGGTWLPEATCEACLEVATRASA